MLDRFRDMLKGTSPQPSPRPGAPGAAGPLIVPSVAPFAGSSVETATPPSRPPDRIKDDLDHGGHFRALARNDHETAQLCIDALAKSRSKKTIVYGGDEVTGYLWGDSDLQVMTVIRNGQTLAAYPVFKAGTPWAARVTQITECHNGYEGQVQISAEGGLLTFFDATYFRDRGALAPGKEVRALVAGIAYVLTRGRGPAGEDDLFVHYEGGDVDDYVLRGTVRAAADFTVLGRKARILKTAIRVGHDSAPRDFYICATPSAMQEKIGPGDRISGIIWLQGFVLP